MSGKDEMKMASAKAQGQTFSEALGIMASMDKHLKQEVGDYIVTIAAEEAEGAYANGNEDDLVWQVPEPDMNQHIEVVVQDKEDLRFLPSLEIHCKVLRDKEEIIAEHRQPFIWHPFLYHYGRNWVIPEEGDYLFEVTIKRPAFLRHDEMRGKRYAKDEILKLGPLHLTPGRKPHGPE